MACVCAPHVSDASRLPWFEPGPFERIRSVYGLCLPEANRDPGVESKESANTATDLKTLEIWLR